VSIVTAGWRQNPSREPGGAVSIRTKTFAWRRSSDPVAEFQETMLKAKAIVQAIALTQRGSTDGTALLIEGA
jgi:hypothetical protein